MMTEESTEWMHPDASKELDKKKKLMNMYLNSKSKIMASVYNVCRRYPSSPASFSLSPIVLLGQCFQCDSSIAQFHMLDDDDTDSDTNYSPTSTKNNHNYPPHVARFLKDFESLLWFSYRKDFFPLGPAQITSDIGWGCMLRTGQMMLAHSLLVHFLGRDWRLKPPDLQPFSQYRQILRLFTDSPGAASPFSLHNIVQKNKAMTPIKDAVYKGEAWFTPSVISKVLRSLVHQYGPSSFSMYVPAEGVVYIDKVVALCTQPKAVGDQRVTINNDNGDPPNVGENEFRSVFILVPLRLGIEKLNPIYYKSIFDCLLMPQTVGIIGGKPKQAFYFVGFQDEHLIYLDPHIVQETVRPDREFSNETYHCRVPQKIHIADVDPSLAVGFFCRNKREFDDFCDTVTKLERETDFIFSVAAQQPVYGSDDEDDDVVVV